MRQYFKVNIRQIFFYKTELQEIFNVRKSGKRFVRFIEKHSSGFFKGGNFKAKHLKIKPSNLGRVLNIIYTARSKYLHAGEPMFMHACSTMSTCSLKWAAIPLTIPFARAQSFRAES